jgi:hypothetical protein
MKISTPTIQLDRLAGEGALLNNAIQLANEMLSCDLAIYGAASITNFDDGHYETITCQRQKMYFGHDCNEWDRVEP